jgi:hypothetical protein
MNADCRWPSEAAAKLDVTKHADASHLTVDAELIAELVDRHRFRGSDAQRACDTELVNTVARIHHVSLRDVEGARAQISKKGLDLAVNVPVAALFLYAAVAVTRLIRRRFPDEAGPSFVSMVVASIVVSGFLVVAGEFWTSILQMVRVGSLHVGGRVHELPWPRHEPEIFVIGVVAFWIVAVPSYRRTARGHG